MREKESEYRIMERAGEFSIQIKVKYSIGFLWWKKNIEEWRSCDKYGRRIVVGYNHMYFLTPFKTLVEAKDKVNEFRKGVKYHEV